MASSTPSWASLRGFPCNIFLAVACLTQSASALSILPSNEASVLAAAVLEGSANIALTSSSYVGATAASGTYTEGPLGINDGSIFTSGNAVGALPGSGFQSTDNGQTGSTLCSQAINNGVSVHDAAVLTLNVMSSSASNGLTASFIFASNEYPA